VKESLVKVNYIDPLNQLSDPLKHYFLRESQSFSESSKSSGSVNSPLRNLTIVMIDGLGRRKLKHFFDSAINESSYLLVSEDAGKADLISLLRYPVCGIVSLSFLEKQFGTLLRALDETGTVLEPGLLVQVALKIDEKREQKEPIKELVLNRESVIGIFTDKEAEVFQLILHGCSNQEIGKKLYFAVSTINMIVSKIIRKLEVNDRTAAVNKAIRNGWVVAER
jgi:DNA-binding NarL/FixJ family response regulator